MSIFEANFYDLRVKDVQELTRLVEAGQEKVVLDQFATYLVSIETSDEVELNDISKIVNQLNATGVWDKIKPETFLASVAPHINALVFSKLQNTFKLSEFKIEDQSRIGLQIEITPQIEGTIPQEAVAAELQHTKGKIFRARLGRPLPTPKSWRKIKKPLTASSSPLKTAAKSH